MPGPVIWARWFGQPMFVWSWSSRDCFRSLYPIMHLKRLCCVFLGLSEDGQEPLWEVTLPTLSICVKLTDRERQADDILSTETISVAKHVTYHRPSISLCRIRMASMAYVYNAAFRSTYTDICPSIRYHYGTSENIDCLKNKCITWMI